MLIGLGTMFPILNFLVTRTGLANGYRCAPRQVVEHPSVRLPYSESPIRRLYLASAGNCRDEGVTDYEDRPVGFILDTYLDTAPEPTRADAGLPILQLLKRPTAHETIRTGFPPNQQSVESPWMRLG
jgi:hypothetical protein